MIIRSVWCAARSGGASLNSRIGNLAAAVLISLAMSTVAATATPIEYDLENLTFSAGDAFGSGSFTFDPSTDTYSNVNITMGDGFASATYTAAEAGSTAAEYIGNSSVFTFNVLELFFSPALDGSSVSPIVSPSGPSDQFGDNTFFITGGAAVPIGEIPEPSTLSLLSGILMGLLLVRALRLVIKSPKAGHLVFGSQRREPEVSPPMYQH
jgi:hypothetical protein